MVPYESTSTVYIYILCGGFAICFFFLGGGGYQAPVTDKVFFDVEIDGVPAGRVIMGLYGGAVPRTAANFIGLCKGDPVSAMMYTGFSKIVPLSVRKYKFNLLLQIQHYKNRSGLFVMYAKFITI